MLAIPTEVGAWSRMDCVYVFGELQTVGVDEESSLHYPSEWIVSHQTELIGGYGSRSSRRTLASFRTCQCRCGLVASRWRLGMPLKIEAEVRVPLWIRFPDLPMQMWNRKVLAGIAKMIGGTLLDADLFT
ncbi:hypothetical protein EJ110_NYTH21207 [Nymphaea thermarum]|nr:hypothetical protein EJ110_NYTH21207 [Nymphaea thermarum]